MNTHSLFLFPAYVVQLNFSNGCIGYTFPVAVVQQFLINEMCYFSHFFVVIKKDIGLFREKGEKKPSGGKKGNASINHSVVIYCFK